MNTGHGLRMGRAEWGLLLALSVLWGGAFFFAKLALGELPPLTVALLRVGLAAAALQALLRVRGVTIHAIRRRDALIMGIFNNVVPFMLMFWAMTRISSGLAAILNGTSPFWGALLAHGFTEDERLSPRKAAGIAVGVAGVAVICGRAALAGLGHDVLAQAAVLLGAFTYGIAGVYARRLKGSSPWAIAGGQLTASSLLLLPLVAWADRPWSLPMPGGITWGALAGLALLSTALGHGLYFRILTRAGATNALLVTLLIPVSALLLGVMALGESIVPRQLAGMVLILAGLALLDGRVLKVRWRRIGRRARSEPVARLSES